MSLLTDQFALGEDPNAYLFGIGTDVEVTSWTPGDLDVTTNDTAVGGEDGSIPGLDTANGRTLTLEMLVNTYTAADGRAAWNALSAAWDAPDIRSVPGAVTCLRMALPGKDPVRIYGRPRKCSPADTSGVRQGAIPVAAEFQDMGGLYYSDELHSITLSLAPTDPGGFVWPITWPVTFQVTGERQDVVRNQGSSATWPIITFNGPIAQPGVRFPNGVHVYLATTLAAGQSITLNTFPWVRTTLSNFGASYAGAIRGGRLSDLKLPPGTTDIGFTGSDNTLQSSCVIAWRDANSAP